jgi:hypothetical protein
LNLYSLVGTFVNLFLLESITRSTISIANRGCISGTTDCNATTLEKKLE